jgi:hypothetical protein
MPASRDGAIDHKDLPIVLGCGVGFIILGLE